MGLLLRGDELLSETHCLFVCFIKANVENGFSRRADVDRMGFEEGTSVISRRTEYGN